jgi:hypothetical protein
LVDLLRSVGVNVGKTDGWIGQSAGRIKLENADF